MLAILLQRLAIQTNDHLSRQMLAYSRLIIREALHHGGPG